MQLRTFRILFVSSALPTYLLPLLGSNAWFLRSRWFGLEGWEGIEYTVLHAACLAALALVCELRGRTVGGSGLARLIGIAAVFDLAPVLSALPGVPSYIYFLVFIHFNNEAAKR